MHDRYCRVGWLLCVTLALSGCSVLFMERAPRDVDTRTTFFRCSSAFGWPMLDMGYGAVLAAVGLNNLQVTERARPVPIGSVVTGAVLVVSAFSGFHRSSECQKARERYVDRVFASVRAPSAPAPARPAVVPVAPVPVAAPVLVAPELVLPQPVVLVPVAPEPAVPEASEPAPQPAGTGVTPPPEAEPPRPRMPRIIDRWAPSAGNGAQP